MSEIDFVESSSSSLLGSRWSTTVSLALTETIACGVGAATGVGRALGVATTQTDLSSNQMF